MESSPDGRLFLADELRRAASGERAASDRVFAEEGALSAALSLFDQYDAETEKILLNSAFARYKDLPLDAKLALALYGEHMKGSVSRLEKFAECPYAHFLSYGLQLREKEDHSFESKDMGSVFHEILKDFSKALIKEGYTLRDFPDDKGNELLKDIVDRTVIGYDQGLLYDTERSTAVKYRIERIMKRTVDVLRFQLQQGDMEPAEYEKEYIRGGDATPLKGIIDRLDKTEDGSYIKILDYKSGNKKFRMDLFYHGIDIQLMTYLSAVLDENKDAHPAGVLYYHLDDPLVDLKEDASEQAALDEIRKKLRMHGVVSGDPAVRAHVDRAEAGAFQAIALTLNKDGSTRKGENSILQVDEDDMRKLSEYADLIIKKKTEEIRNGVISVSPYEMEKLDACKYCAFRTVCGYDEKIPGYCHRELEKMDGNILLEKIREELK